MAGNLNYHPAPGLSEILPGWYSVPQNPITARAYGITYTPGIGEILNSPTIHFNEPDNPLRNFVAGRVKALGQSGDCGCGGGCGGCGGHGGCGGGKPRGQINGMGVGDLSTDWQSFTSDLGSGSFLQAIQQPILGAPVWGWALGAIGAFLLFGPSGSSRYSRSRKVHA